MTSASAAHRRRLRTYLVRRRRRVETWALWAKPLDNSAVLRVRRVGRIVLGGLVSPPIVGAAYLAGIAAWSGTRTGAVDSDIGDVRRADAVETFMNRRFPAELLRMKVGVIATALALGLVIGLLAEVVVRLRRRPRVTLRARFVESVILVAALHAALVLWAMGDTPQLYAAEWYAQGGLPRFVQLLATDTLGPHGVILATFIAVIAYIRPNRFAYWAQRAFGVLRKPLRYAAPALALLISSDAASAPAPPQQMNVLILAADSLRADHLDPHLAPNLAKLAGEGTRFDKAYVSLPRTFPSWVSILTGRHAHHHGIRSMFPTWEERAKDFDAVPERFAKSGYATSVVSDYAGDIFGRIDLGFSNVQTPSFDFRQIIRQKVLERETPLLPILHSHTGRSLFPVMRELSTGADPQLLADDIIAALNTPKNKPFFLTAFFSTAHFPYAAPAPYYRKFTDKGYRGRFKYHKPVGLNRGEELPPDSDDIRQINGLYDGAVNAIDDAVGRVLHALERKKLADHTIVVITADHGEMLYDNGHGQGHGDHLFGDEVIHVPLVVFDPRVKQGRREPHIVRDVDLAPTLYELCGVEKPGDLDGRSYAPALKGEPFAPKLAYAESELWFTEDIPSLPAELRMPYPGIMALTEIDGRHNAEIVLRKDMVPATTMARHRMVRDERWKLIYVPTRAGVKWMLYDTVADPTEQHDVAAEHPAEVKRLEADLWSWMLEDSAMEQKNGFLVPKAVSK
jgi:arylsulfatase A-like enzyme